MQIYLFIILSHFLNVFFYIVIGYIIILSHVSAQHSIILLNIPLFCSTFNYSTQHSIIQLNISLFCSTFILLNIPFFCPFFFNNIKLVMEVYSTHKNILDQQVTVTYFKFLMFQKIGQLTYLFNNVAARRKNPQLSSTLCVCDPLSVLCRLLLGPIKMLHGQNVAQVCLLVSEQVFRVPLMLGLHLFIYSFIIFCVCGDMELHCTCTLSQANCFQRMVV